MASLVKKIVLLWLLFLSPFAFADGEPTYVSITSTKLSESSAGTEKMVFTVKLSSMTMGTTITYTTYDGSANAGEDYESQSGTLSFWAGETEETIEIEILDDAEYEGDESFYIQIGITEAGFALSGDGKGYGTIIDDELPPITLTLYDRYFSETDSNRSIAFTAQLNREASAGGVTITYTTLANTAMAGSDYVETNGTLIIPEKQNKGYIYIPIIADTMPENMETFTVKILSISEGSLNKGEAIGKIWDDDAIRVAIGSSDALEGNIGDNNVMPFRIYLTKAYPLTTPLKIDYRTQDGSLPSATAGSDYTALTGSVTFNYGEIEKIVNVPIIGDNEIEKDEYLKMIISGSSYIIDVDSESKILNDDGSYPSVNFSTTPFSILEGNSSTTTLNFHFTLDKPAIAGTSFQYFTQDGGATTTDHDYVGVPLTPYTILEGEQEITIPITINGDTRIENDESFWLKIQNEEHLNVSGHTSEGIILNDDGSYPSATFDLDTFSETEGNVGEKTLNFTLTLDKPAVIGSGFDYYTQDGTAQSSDNDYTAIAISQKKHFDIPLNATEVTLPITLVGDKRIENDEDFRLYLVNESNLTINGSHYARGVIVNDDGNYPKVSLSAPVVSGNEGDSGSQNVHFTIKLDTPAAEDGITVNVQTNDGTATILDNDYEAINLTTVTFNTNEQEKDFDVTVYGDIKVEENETFSVALSNPKNSLLSETNTSLTITIINDDEHSNEAFICDSNMYLSSSIKRGSSAISGKMWLHRIDTTKNPFEFNVIDEVGDDKLYNALAYSTNDNYIYGLYNKELIKISKTGKIIPLGKIDALPDILDNLQLYAGAIYGDYYYVTGPGTNYDKIFKIKLADKSVTDINLTEAISVLDFSFTPDGNSLYGIVDGGKMVKIDSVLGTVTFIGNAHNGYQFDSTFSDANGRFFANDSYGGGFFEFNLDTGEKLFLSASQPAQFNDGANCLDAVLVFTDYGDAPVSYGTPRHTIANGIFMGTKIDHDITAYNDINALADDLSGVDDEDGVTLPNGSDLNGTYFKPDTTQELQITVSKEGYLNAWIDYDINGIFDASDKIISSMSLTAGTHTLSFPIPATVPLNETTYMRFRFSSTPTLDAIQNTTDGEVEDYAVQFGEPFKGVKGTFNVQRPDSVYNAKDYALYTQIVGRDFDYHVVFYDENFETEKELSGVPVKIDLIDEESNDVLYTYYSYFSHTNIQSRIPVEINGDLDTIPATKRARFRITYAANADDSIVQQECNGNYQTCFNDLVAVSDKNSSFLSQDDFAIRPERFYFALADGSDERINNEYSNTTLRVAAGYDYNLTLIATQYNSRDAAQGYTKNFTAQFDFNTTGLTHCQSVAPIQESVHFNEGFYNNPHFTHQNAGRYLLDLMDASWTAVDQAHGDCEVDHADTSSNPNSKSGCNITVRPHPIELLFFPYQFGMNFTQNNLPSNAHSDFIYMSDLNVTHDIGVQFIGTISAQNQNGTPTTNFTAGCMAQAVHLFPNATTLTEDGIVNPNGFPKTIMVSSKTRTGDDNVSVARRVELNDNGSSTVDYITDINQPFTLHPRSFLDENNGSLTIDLRYNLKKPLNRTVNPVKFTFHELNTTSTDANSTAEHQMEYIPSGGQTLNDTVRHFYFSQVVPDQVNYPTIVFSVSPIIRTPLNVDIFCDKSKNYCIDTRVIAHSDIAGSPRKQEGWYLSVEHNSSVDGTVLELNPDAPIVSFQPTPSLASPLEFSHGRNGMLISKFDSYDANNKKVTIFIRPSPQLLYSQQSADNGEPHFTINCVLNPPSQWTGVGETGNIIESKPNTASSKKIEW